jgi:hypothetical protein
MEMLMDKHEQDYDIGTHYLIRDPRGGFLISTIPTDEDGFICKDCTDELIFLMKLEKASLLKAKRIRLNEANFYKTL